MPRFYFNLRNDLCVDDEEGQELPNFAAAEAVALTNARSIAADNVLHGRLNLSHRIEIADEAGRVLGTVTFAEAVKVED